jgi:signal peptidase
MSTLTGESELWAPVRRLRLGARKVGTAAWWRRWTFVGVMSVFVAMILASYAVPLWYQLHGDRLLVVTSGSMAPEIQAGDAVVIRQVTSASQLRVGQVITFYPPKSATLVTHRIVGVAYVERVDRDGNGVLDDQGKPLTDPYVKTKGDANRIDDPNLTPATSVRGIVREIHLGWGVPLAFAHSGTGRLLLFGPPLLMLALAELASRGLVPTAWFGVLWRRTVARLRRPRADDAAVGSDDAQPVA